MKIQYCSLAGIDAQTDPGDLIRLGADYPFVEWAVLYKGYDGDKPRYPTDNWIRDFKSAPPSPQIAIHLCDDAITGFIDNRLDVMDMMQGFQRVQLNATVAHLAWDAGQLADRVAAETQWQFLFQFSQNKADYYPLFHRLANCDVLFDESAGRGVETTQWPQPIAGKLCGYAGGLTPDNIADNLAKIDQVAGNRDVWIDMESGIRTDNRFDAVKAERILMLAAAYVR